MNIDVWQILIIIVVAPCLFVTAAEYRAGRLTKRGLAFGYGLVGVAALDIYLLAIGGISYHDFVSIELWQVTGWVYIAWILAFPMLAIMYPKRGPLSKLLIVIALVPVIHQVVTLVGGVYFREQQQVATAGASLIVVITSSLIGHALSSKHGASQNKQSNESRSKPKKESTQRPPHHTAPVNQYRRKTGSGILVHSNFVLTAYHVVNEGIFSTVRLAEEVIHAELIAKDIESDLALIRLEKSIGTKIAEFSQDHTLNQGEIVVNYGYPGDGVLSDSAKFTQGHVNSLEGIKNDGRFFQYDAPTQPGNSGGPVLNSYGSIVGMANHTLAIRYSLPEGYLPQNVNFALKSTVLKKFLLENKIELKDGSAETKMELVDLATKARDFTVSVAMEY